MWQSQCLVIKPPKESPSVRRLCNGISGALSGKQLKKKKIKATIRPSGLPTWRLFVPGALTHTAAHSLASPGLSFYPPSQGCLSLLGDLPLRLAPGSARKPRNVKLERPPSLSAPPPPLTMKIQGPRKSQGLSQGPNNSRV